MRVVFLGSGDIAVPSLDWLLGTQQVVVPGVVTQPDRPAGRGLALRPSRIKQLALSHRVDIFQPGKIRDREAIDRIVSWQPDLIVVMAYGQILPQTLLDVPRLGALNLHASLLPRHRGAAPVHAAILAADRVTGVTSMWMDAGLDTGDVLLRRELHIAPDETAGSLHDRLADLAPKVLEESLRLIREGAAPRVKQDDSQATYAPKLDRTSGRIDWSQSAEEIARRVRGLHPWPGSSADLVMADGRTVTVKILRAAVLAGQAPAGSLKDGACVGCGRGGLLHIQLIQAPGGKAMPASDFFRGNAASRFAAGQIQQQQQAQQ